jgi:DNA-binding transcriptional MerR regulator
MDGRSGYTVNEMAKLAGVSARTLRHYDQIGLLRPPRGSANGYRRYGAPEVDRLQQVMFYRESGLALKDIGAILDSEGFDQKQALAGHLELLKARRSQLDALIKTVEETIAATDGRCKMTDEQKFAGFKQRLIDDNERSYGKEIRQKYGDEAVNRSNARVAGMSKGQYDRAQALASGYQKALRQAFENGDPGSELAQQACDLHRQWLQCYCDGYCREYHLGLAQMYVDDQRFTAYYDEIAPGCAPFFQQAIRIYCGAD